MLRTVVASRVLGLDWRFVLGVREEGGGLRLRIPHVDGRVGGVGWNGLEGLDLKELGATWPLVASYQAEAAGLHERSLDRGIVRVELDVEWLRRRHGVGSEVCGSGPWVGLGLSREWWEELKRSDRMDWQESHAMARIVPRSVR